MFQVRLACLAIASTVLAAACSQTPTGPTIVVPAIAVGDVPQTSAPIPPRDSINPPRALGLTRFVAFGDSITWGAQSAFDPRFIFADVNGGYPDRLQAALNTYHTPQTFTVINEGDPGELAVNAVSRFRSMLTNRRPQAVLLLEGINDLNVEIGVSRAAGALRQMVDAATAAGIPVVIATMYQTYESTDPEGVVRTNGASLVPALNAEIRRLAAGRLNVYVLDLESLMRDRSFVGNDGLHLTNAGFERMATLFLSVIEAAFPVRGSFQ